MYLPFQQFLLPSVFSASQAEESTRAEGINSSKNPRVNILKVLFKMRCLGSQHAHWDIHGKQIQACIINIYYYLLLLSNSSNFLTTFSQV